jgi:ATP/ADP translocase
MMHIIGAAERKFLGFIALLGLFAVPAQLYLAIANRSTDLTETIIRFFSYFTILTNILILISSSFLALNSSTGLTRFFAKPSTRTATAVYISPQHVQRVLFI